MLLNTIAISTYLHHSGTQLWQAIQRDEPKAFELLYRNTVLPLSNQAFRILKDRELVRDILQDVFVSLFIKRKELPGDLNAIGYLHNAVKYKVSTILRDRLSRERHHLVLLRRAEQEQLLPSFPAENNELKKQIRAGIDSLPEKCRQAFMLNHYDSLSYKAIAAEMGISVKTVEKHISKALKLLRKELAEEPYITMTVTMLSVLYLSS